MLISLSVRNVVLIEALDFSFGPGFCVLSGETGAGKSVLMEALALATGRRADASLVRVGTDEGVVTASFKVAADHPAVAFASKHGIQSDGALLCRRVLARNGRGGAFINDVPVTVRLLEQLGHRLLQIHGQHDRRGLLDGTRHQGFLDAFGSLSRELRNLGKCHRAWREAEAAHREAAEGLASTRAAEEEIQVRLAELEALAPAPGEAEQLAERRSFLMQSGRVLAVIEQLAAIMGEGATAAPATPSLHDAAAALDGLPEVSGPFAELKSTLHRALVELGEARNLLDAVRADLELDPNELEQVETRLFALRSAARRHGVTPDELRTVHEELRARAAKTDADEHRVKELEEAASAARQEFEAAVEVLGAGRRKAAAFLDERIGDELEALRMGRARFVTELEELPREKWGPHGGERVRFGVSTMQGVAIGPLERIASGGELSRFLLAVHIVLARVTEPATLVFDEIDAGVGGAVADAVGTRLARLARRHQVFAVTHQPQVAARGRRQWLILRSGDAVSASELDEAARVEEIARMMSGSGLTDEARAAAKRLLQEGGK